MDAVELYRKGFKKWNIATETEVREMQERHPKETPFQIVERVIKEKIKTETSNIRLYTLRKILMYAVIPQQNEEKTAALKAEIERLDRLYWEEFYESRN